MKKKIGIMTGGGDAPGLNGIIESTVRALSDDYHLIGICDGFEGIFNLNTIDLDRNHLIGLHSQAGTLLGTSNKSGLTGREELFLKNFEKLGLEGLIAAGGDGTFSGLKRVSNRIPLIGVPKTIDNDLAGTEVTFGFDTACAVVSESIDALRATANAHQRVIIVETMGRTAGWIALGGGLASYSDVILIPERPFNRTALKKFILEQKSKNRRGLMIAASEGSMASGEQASIAFKVENAPQQERFGGFAEKLARWVEKETDWESRHVVLGHLQRSRPPTTTDRFLTMAMGVEVSSMVRAQAWDHAVVYRQGRVQRAPITDLMKPARLVDRDHRWVEMAKAEGIFI